MQVAFDRLHDAAERQPYPSLDWRCTRLRALQQVLVAYRERLADAVAADYGSRSRDETYIADILPVVNAIKDTVKHLPRWVKPSRRPVQRMFRPAAAKVVYQPLGVVGIIVPWNYPIQLALSPLVGALAAGNRALLKLSEHTPRTNGVLEQLLREVFSDDEVAVIHGGVPVAEAFTRLPFDHLVFTGSTSVGRKVMAAAAENLTPVTLELGGKSPAIVDHDAPMGSTAEHIIFGKTLNAGQTCIAPDYVLCREERVDELLAAMRKAAKRMYRRIDKNPDYTAIINDRHYRRLRSMLDEARERGAELIALHPDEEGLVPQRKLPLHLVLDSPNDTRVMQEEIFGPILPIVPVSDLDAALREVRKRPRPLALYYFGLDNQVQERVLQESHAGGVCINNTLFHIAQDSLPFGGIGDSGMGHYHGREGFMSLSKQKGVYIQRRPNPSRLVYPPYGRLIHKLLYRFFLR
ncbi:coniferyl-aldehyde dehydrogenase [Alkalilimnicola ehrlichii]|uniref:Aldehyde dehydrogenase n=2 Tax=Alkalilimnicola ehrlichii TaxID=351052 RepID=A0A3E0X028_9GAMM|nr:coniferyl-aldehyde dehydrogenase [Alkalilimnicola ehrlichii]RFA37527.1 coniferyl-aldehyde dehydrogenase [Alkalilimnicola ehrlichii]